MTTTTTTNPLHSQAANPTETQPSHANLSILQQQLDTKSMQPEFTTTTTTTSTTVVTNCATVTITSTSAATGTRKDHMAVAVAAVSSSSGASGERFVVKSEPVADGSETNKTNGKEKVKAKDDLDAEQIKRMRRKNRISAKKSRLKKKRKLEALSAKLKEMTEKAVARRVLVTTLQADMQNLMAKVHMYKQLTDECFDMISLHAKDAYATFLYCSSASEKLLGWKSEDLIGKTPYDIFHKDDMERIIVALTMGLACNEVPSVIYRMKCKNGTYKVVNSSLRQVRCSAC